MSAVFQPTALAGVLTSRIGRRFVGAFAGCALLPLVVFAWISVSRVTDQMRSDLQSSLHNSAKTAGMGLAARLSQIAADLALAADLLRNSGPEEAWSDGVVLQRQVGDRNEAIWLLDGNVSRVLCGTTKVPALQPGPAELARLVGGRPLLRIIGDPASLVMIAAVNHRDPDSPLVAAKIRSEWFWDPQELRGPGCEFVACDLNGQLLYHTFREQPALGDLVSAVAKQPSSGNLSWSPAGDPHVARYWRVFLRPQYDVDLVVVQSRAEREALVVAASFVRWFWLTAASTLLVVVLASLIQLRRTLVPIVELGRATLRFGQGDLDARARIDSKDEFGDLGRAFNDMADRLQENISERRATEAKLVTSRDAALAAAKAKAEFVTNVSHELRTPMAEILGAVEILTQLGDGDRTAREEFAAIALHGAQRLARLLDDVLELGQATGGQEAPVDVRVTLQDAVALMPQVVRQRISQHVAADLPLVSGHAQQLVQTWCRLLDNAAKFSPPDSPIEVVARRNAGEVVVEIRDRGVGIDPADHERIFEPFSQVGRDQLLDKAKGAGLGLSLVRNAVKRHGGRIVVDSALGRGAKLRVVLPALAAAKLAAR